MHFRLRKKKVWDTLGCLSLRFKIQERHVWKHFWMFFDAHLDQVEILTPTLDVIEDVKRDGLVYAVKGFASYREFKAIDELRYHYCMASYNFTTRCIGNSLFLKAFEAMMNNEAYPSDEDVQNEIEKNRLQVIETDEDAKKIDERNLWYDRMTTYGEYLMRIVLHMFESKRVYSLETMELASVNDIDLDGLREIFNLSDLNLPTD